MIEHLNEQSFREKVFDYTQSNDFKYVGDVPCIIDFYADWCGPCKMIAPILEELAEMYDGKVIFYKVDTEEQTKLSNMFGIRSIPSLLFVPVGKAPKMDMGAKRKNELIAMIDDFFNIK